MRAVVLGGGIIGTTTAYYLSSLGHEVVVIERQAEVGLETSYANGALVTPSTSDSWAAPGTPYKLLKWIGHEDAPMLLRLSAIPGMIGWGLRFLANCRQAAWRANTEAVLALALYSRAELRALVDAQGLQYDRTAVGILKLFRDRLSMEGTRRSADLYRELGVQLTALEPAQCVALEPNLAPVAEQIHGGIHYPLDESGDAWTFTRELAARARGQGAEFRFGTTVEGFKTANDRIDAVVTNDGPVVGDCYVLALGCASRDVGRKLGLSLPIHPAKGYSATVNLAGWNRGPKIPIVDDGRKMAVTPLGDRLRLAGTVEFAGYDLSLNPRRGAMLLDGLRHVFPDYPRNAKVEHWAGLRPLTPSGRPILGPSPWRNLFLNIGHGPLGWTLACGSGKAVADLAVGRQPSIDLAPFALAMH